MQSEERFLNLCKVWIVPFIDAYFNNYSAGGRGWYKGKSAINQTGMRVGSIQGRAGGLKLFFLAFCHDFLLIRNYITYTNVSFFVNPFPVSEFSRRFALGEHCRFSPFPLHVIGRVYFRSAETAERESEKNFIISMIRSVLFGRNMRSKKVSESSETYCERNFGPTMQSKALNKHLIETSWILLFALRNLPKCALWSWYNTRQKSTRTHDFFHVPYVE